MERKAKAATQTGLYLLIVAAILVVANLISFRSYQRFDMTKNERFTLSKGSARLVSEGLKQELTIDVYATRGLAKNEIFVQDLSDLLKEYEKASQGKLKFSVIEPKSEEEKEAAKKEGLQEALFGEGSETADQTTIGKGFMGLVFKYGTEKDVIPFWPPNDTQGIEFFITNKIREIRDRADKIEQKFGILTGKDEIKLTDANLFPGPQGPSIRQVIEEYLKFYKFEDVDLQGGEAEINKELVGLIITQPGKPFTDKELRRIDQFLMLGNKAVVVIAGAVNMKASDASMKATLDTHGLEKLLDGYGIEMKKEAILDWGRSISIPAQTQMGQPIWLRAPGIVQVMADERYEGEQQLLDNAFAPFFRVEEISFPFPSTLVPHPEKQPEAKLKVVARSTPRTTVETSETLSMKYSDKWSPKGEYGQRAMAIAVEGVLASAFTGGDNQGVEAAAKSAAPSRLLVVASPQLYANPFARAGNPPPMPPQLAMMGQMGGDRELQMVARDYFDRYFRPMIFTFKNTLDWMAGDADLIAASAKLLGEPNLSYSDIEKPSNVAEEVSEEEMAKKMESYRAERAATQKKIQWTLTFLPAALFAAYGLLRWRMREAARDKELLA